MNPADIPALLDAALPYLAGAALGLLVVVIAAWAALMSWSSR